MAANGGGSRGAGLPVRSDARRRRPGCRDAALPGDVRPGRAPAGQWAREVEPLLEDEWRRSAGLSNTTFVATADELAEVESAIEELLAPYVLRKSNGVSVPGPAMRADAALRPARGSRAPECPSRSGADLPARKSPRDGSAGVSPPGPTAPSSRRCGETDASRPTGQGRASRSSVTGSPSWRCR